MTLEPEHVQSAVTPYTSVLFSSDNVLVLRKCCIPVYNIC